MPSMQIQQRSRPRAEGHDAHGDQTIRSRCVELSVTDAAPGAEQACLPTCAVGGRLIVMSKMSIDAVMASAQASLAAHVEMLVHRRLRAVEISRRRHRQRPPWRLMACSCVAHLGRGRRDAATSDIFTSRIVTSTHLLMAH